jgi:hypothetical protein
MSAAPNLQALADAEMVAIGGGLCEMCVIEAIKKARTVVGEHYRLMLRQGHAPEDAARYAAKCAARIAAEVQELEAHRQMQPTPAELDAIVKRVSAGVRIELWGSLQ